jgi:hypothetical protein
MECKETLENLTLHLLGDLPEDRERALAEHLSACESCRKEEARLGTVLDALEGLPEMQADPGRRARLFKAAAEEGLLPARPITVRFLLASSSILAAAAVLFWVSLAAGWWGKGEVPEPPPDNTMVSPGNNEPEIKPVAQVASVTGQAQLVRKAKQTGRAPKRLEPLYRGDRIVVNGKDSEVKLRFHEDALLVTLEGGIPGGTEVRLGGDSNTAYEIRLERGHILGRFESGPLEKTKSRNTEKGIIPLTIASPVARFELERGQQFDVTQEKTHLWKNYSGSSMRGGKPVFNLYFDGHPLSKFRNQNLHKILGESVGGDGALLEGKKVSFLGRGVPVSEFIPLFDRTLGPMGLSLKSTGGNLAIEKRAGGATKPASSAASVGHGEFTVTLVAGRGKLSTHHPVNPGTVTLFGGQIGRVRPGQDKVEALSIPPTKAKKLEDGTVLVGVFVSPSGRWGIFEQTRGGNVAIKTLEVGDSLDMGNGLGAYTLAWVGWNSVTLVVDGRETELALKK